MSTAPDPTGRFQRAVDEEGTWLVRPIIRLWSHTFVFNLVGGLGPVTVSHVAQGKGARDS